MYVEAGGTPAVPASRYVVMIKSKATRAGDFARLTILAQLFLIHQPLSRTHTESFSRKIFARLMVKPITSMNRSIFLCALIAALLIFQTVPVAALDEGMWTFNNVPRQDIKQKYGFEVTDEWLHRVQLASVRFPGGSGSFVSPNGLVLTNYHIVEDIVGELSTPAKDYAKEGFVARSQAEEMKAEGLELNQLISIEDVTTRVTGAVRDGMSAAE